MEADQPTANDHLGAGVASLIERGESAHVEFKATLRFDLKTLMVNNELTKAVVKVVASFMNTQGGTLIIGVADDRSLLGLEPDIQTLGKQNLDGFELTLRNSLAASLGVEVAPNLLVDFPTIGEVAVACIRCPPHPVPVFVRDGDQYRFFVRDGNQSKSLNVQAAHSYIKSHWSEDRTISESDIETAVAKAVRAEIDFLQPEALGAQIRAAMEQAGVPRPIALPGDSPPPWLRVGTRRVIDLFLTSLAHSRGWKRLYLVSPWLSDITDSVSLTSTQLCQRVKDDGATVYLVTRPPETAWHEDAIARLGETGRANVALVPGLHTKLYAALTVASSFALLGSANFTQQSLANREIGVLINSYAEGRRVVSDLQYEAAQLYRLPGRRLLYQASFVAN